VRRRGETALRRRLIDDRLQGANLETGWPGSIAWMARCAAGASVSGRAAARSRKVMALQGRCAHGSYICIVTAWSRP
jgi:hypothetical protein